MILNYALPPYVILIPTVSLRKRSHSLIKYPRRLGVESCDRDYSDQFLCYTGV